MRTLSHSRQAAALALAALAISPAAAQALPTLSADHECYAADYDPMVYTGAGFTSGAAITLMFAANGQVGSYDATADQAGAFSAKVIAPKLSMFDIKEPRFTLGVTANDESKLGPTGPIGPAEESFAATTVTISDWWVKVTGWSAKHPVATRGKRMQLKAGGWASAGSALYIHYYRGTKDVHTEKLGALTGPCGDLSTSFKAFAFKSAKPGSYKVRISGSPKWNSDDRWWEYRPTLK